MPSTNLAAVIGPNLMKSTGNTADMLGAIKDANLFCNFLITNYWSIFRNVYTKTTLILGAL